MSLSNQTSQLEYGPLFGETHLKPGESKTIAVQNPDGSLRELPFEILVASSGLVSLYNPKTKEQIELRASGVRLNLRRGFQPFTLTYGDFYGNPGEGRPFIILKAGGANLLVSQEGLQVRDINPRIPEVETSIASMQAEVRRAVEEPTPEKEPLNARLIKLVAEPIDAKYPNGCKIGDRIYKGADIAHAIPDQVAFLREVDSMQEGTFFELNEAGELAMKDGCKEAYGLGEDARQAEKRQTRIVYRGEDGSIQVMEGYDYFTADENGNLVVSDAGKKIKEDSILMKKGLPTLQKDEATGKHTGEYARMNDSGQFERQKLTWTKDKSLDASLARDVCWSDDRGGVDSLVHRSDFRSDSLGSRGVLRVKLNLTVESAPEAIEASETSQAEPDQAELSPERERTLGLLLARYDENLDKGLYTAESAPKAEVEKWLRQDPTRLDTAARWEARGGHPVFAVEEDGDFCIAEASKEVPSDIRNICYGPNAAKFECLSEDRNALTQSKNLGGTLISKWLREKLFVAGLIQNSDTWEWLLDPENRDLVREGNKVKYFGLAWSAGYGFSSQHDPLRHDDDGGLRCELRGKRIEASDGPNRPLNTAEPDQAELSPEREATLTALEANYERLQHLSNGVTWAAAEKSLRKHPEVLDKLEKLLKERPNSDLTVVGRKDGEIKFMEAAANCPGIKNIAYDLKGEEGAKSRGEKGNGNAVDVAASFGAKPASTDLYESLRGKVPGLDESTWAWLLTDAATRESGDALFGDSGYVRKHIANYHVDGRGVRCELGVEEA